MKAKLLGVTFLILITTTTSLWADAKGRTTIIKRLNVEGAYTPKVLGLFIGIQEYRDPFWHDLKYPEKDVRDMVEFFTNNATLELDYKMVLTKPEETTRNYIFNHKLDEFKMKNSSDKDVVIVYISSHGTLTKELVTVIQEGKKTKEPRKVPYILTSDALEGKIADSALALYKVIDWFEKLRSQRKVLILDMCHSGRFGKSQLSPDQADLIESAKGINYTPMEDSWASIILAACPIGGVSFEDNALKNSVYTHFLIEGMRLGDLNKDGAVSISEAHNYAIDETHQYTWEFKQYKQVPTTYSRILGKDPIIVFGASAKKATPTLFSYSSANYGVDVYLDGVHQAMLPKGIVVKPGVHKVMCKYDGRTIFNEKIKIIPGNDYMLPYFKDLKHEKEKTSFFLAEGGYRNYARSDVAEELAPGTPTIGFSLHRYGIITDWIGLSFGLNYGGSDDLAQYAANFGIKLTTPLSRLRLFAGPDVMVLFFRYASDLIAEKRVDQEVMFFCPGAEVFLTYKFKMNAVLSFGVRAHYMPYSLGSEIYNMFDNQVFIAAGILF